MKLKKLFSVIGLGLFAVASVSAGVLAFAKGPRMEMAKADPEPDDSIVTFILNLGEATGYDGFNSPEVHIQDTTGTSIDKYQMMHKVTGNYYMASITYRSADQDANYLEFLFKQNSEDKWSTSAAISLSGNSNKVMLCSYNNTWAPDGEQPTHGYEWELTTNAWTSTRFQYYGDGDNNIQNVSFTPDIASKTFKATFEVVDKEGAEFDPDDLGQVFFGTWGLAAFRQASVDEYMNDYTTNSFKLLSAGKYDIILHNEFADGGVFELKKYTASEEYIYLVGEDISPETAIYSFGEGGFKGYGDWPGTRLKNVAGAVQVQGDLKYQGTTKYIWKVTLEIGYPKADHIILASVNEFDVVGLQTGDMPLARKRSFHFVQDLDDHDDLEGAAIDWLLETEAVRKAATNESVCSVSKENAVHAVNIYQSLGAYMQSEYVDCTLVNTWTDNTKTAKGYVSYRKVVEQLAKIAEIDLGETNTTVSFGYKTNETMLIAVISVITTISVAGVVALVVIRKRKHQ